MKRKAALLTSQIAMNSLTKTACEVFHIGGTSSGCVLKVKMGAYFYIFINERNYSDDESAHDFIDVFIKEMRNQAGNENTSFTSEFN